MDVEGPRRSTIFFEKIGGYRNFVLALVIFDRFTLSLEGPCPSSLMAGQAEHRGDGITMLGSHDAGATRCWSYFSTGRPKHSTYPLLSVISKARSPSPVLASSRCMGTCRLTNSVYSESGSSVPM